MTWADTGAALQRGWQFDGFNFGADFCKKAAARNKSLVAEEDEVTGEDEGEMGRWRESNIAAQPDTSSPEGHHKGFSQLQHC